MLQLRQSVKMYVSSSILVVLLLSTLTVASPVNKLSTVIEMTPNKISDVSLLDTVKSTLGKVHSHLTTWLQHANYVLHHHLVRRDVHAELQEAENVTANITSTEKPEHYFEEYEKQYYINQTMNLLKGILLYNEYETNGTMDGNRVDNALQRKLRELNAMPLEDVQTTFSNVQNAAQTGHVGLGISRLCCQMG